MPIQLSPSVAVVEKDLTNVIPAVAASVGATIVDAAWGPVLDVTSIDSENVLIQRFGRPNNSNFTSWFTAANFLSYSNTLLVARPESAGMRNAVADLTGSVSALTLAAGGSGYHTGTTTVSIGAPTVSGGIQATATARLTDRIGSIAVGVAGSGYVQGTTTVSISAPIETWGVQATATATVTAGEITGITLTNPGKGYSAGSPPTATIVGAGTSATLTVTMQVGVVESLTITSPGTGYETGSVPSVSIVDSNISPGSGAAVTAVIVEGGIKILNQNYYENYFDAGEGVVGEFAAKYPGSLGNSLTVSMADAASFTTWAYKDQFESAPGTSEYATANTAVGDELHVVVVDRDGKWTGVAGSVLEAFGFCSKASDARKSDGTSAYYRNVINTASKYVWWTDHPSVGSNWGTAANAQTYASIGSTAITRILSGGVDDYASTDGQKMIAFDLFSNDEELDVSLIPVGKASASLASYVIQSIAEVRKDAVAFVSPQNITTGDAIVGSTSDEAEKIVAYRNLLPSSSYGVMDSGFKYQYDKYNDVYRWVPLNGDIAGLCARTDYTNDPWFSPGGLNRGQIKNVVKLAYSPRKSDRDTLYKSGVNPVVAFPGQGVVLYGDKTLLSKPSAFDRINVRRLFIVLEKAIATAAKYQLFEFNDGFTQAQFRNMVEPYLRDVKGRRGLTDFKVLCDSTNNTSEVVDSNRFVADIFIKPSRSINFVTLNFVATRSGASFSEIAG